MIVSISGKLNSGKDTVGKISQILTNFPEMSDSKVVKNLDKEFSNNIFEIKRFADKLKDIVCLLLNCTREQLEDREFKEKELGEEWAIVQGDDYKVLSKEGFPKDMWTYLTPRKLLQLLGTECGREIIHPNIWVNALMSGYVPREGNKLGSLFYPNWIITDMRFPNELKAVEDRGGITIRVNRDIVREEQFEKPGGKKVFVDRKTITDIVGEHPSETALDNAKFNYTIDNNGTLLDLVQVVRKILKERSII